MKALRSLRTIASVSFRPWQVRPSNHTVLCKFYSAQPQEDNSDSSDHLIGSDSVFDSADFTLPNGDSAAETPSPVEPTWDIKYRERADKLIFGKEIRKGKLVDKEQEEERRRRVLAKALLEAALAAPDAEEEENDDKWVKEEDQMSLSVGIIGAPNAGKSALTNFMVGTKVAAVSRKTNTTTHEVLGVMTKGNTQITLKWQQYEEEFRNYRDGYEISLARVIMHQCFFDTPGLTLKTSGVPHKDVKVRLQSAWSSVELYDALIVIFDVHRHLTRPDSRVIGLIKRMGAQPHPKQKRILCMNKVDLVETKKDLLKVAEQFKDLPGYEKYFMISGLKGAGVKDLSDYLMEQAVKRPWDEDPLTLTEEVMKNLSLEVVRERLLDHVHQEIPYAIEHRLVDWKELKNGSLRIEQHLITEKLSQRKILVGKNGSKIGRIGMEANEELRSILKREVHLILQVKLK